jgi:hypothetical protein
MAKIDEGVLNLKMGNLCQLFGDKRFFDFNNILKFIS